jgi:hypothetical protein
MKRTSRLLAAAVVAATAAWAAPNAAADDAAPVEVASARPSAADDFLVRRSELLNAPVPPFALAEDRGATWDIRGTAWAYSTDANVSLDTGGGGAHYDASFGESIFTGFRLEVLRNRIGGLLEVEWTDTQASGGGTNLDLTSRRIDIGGIFRVVGVDENGRGLTLDLFGGARYWYSHEDFSNGPSDHDDWWEPFFGAETRVPIPALMDVVARLQTSGLVGGKSTINADLTVAAEFRIGPVSLQLGWRFHQVRYDLDPNTEADISQNGPWVGVGMDF